MLGSDDLHVIVPINDVLQGETAAMRENVYYLLFSLLVLPLAGCTMCSGSLDENYAAHGGVWERENPSRGRVGSAFSSTGHAKAIEDSSIANPPVEPEPYYEAAPLLGPPIVR